MLKPTCSMLVLSASLLTGLLFVGLTKAVADETVRWTGWMGPQRNGWVSYFQPPQAWPEQLERGWRIEVGTGYASPLVADGRIFQHARQGEEEVLWCLDAETGKTLWRRSYKVPFKIGSGGERHGKGPKATPAYADGRLFTRSISGVLSAWDADSGRLLWQRDYSTQFKTGHPYWGAAGSPVVDGNRVIVRMGNDDRGALVALDVATGEELWRQGDHSPAYSSPLVVDVAGVRQVIDWNQQALVGVDVESGRLLWEFPVPQEGYNQNMPTPTFFRGSILLGAENRGIRSIQPHFDGDQWKATQRWHQRELALDMSSAVLNGDWLFGLSHYDKGRLFCLDPQTGQIHWTGPPRTGQHATFLAIPGYVVALIHTGELRIIAATAERYELVRSYRVSERETWAPPVLLADGILVKDETSLARWSLKGPGGARPASDPSD